MMSHIDCWSTLAAMAGITPPPTGEMKDNNGKPIYFDSIDNSAYILGKAQHSARRSWVYINGEYLNAIRVDIGWRSQRALAEHRLEVHVDGEGILAGPDAGSGLYPGRVQPHHGSLMRSYDMVFNGSRSRGERTDIARKIRRRRQRLVGGALLGGLADFDKTIMQYPSIQRSPGGASNDLIPDLQHPKNPVPLSIPTTCRKQCLRPTKSQPKQGACR